nr:RNA-directed DNA polymerase, eukaryota, reverse transcriptase zinc-binding domain protein [Tanacetum cinerariifolium]
FLVLSLLWYKLLNKIALWVSELFNRLVTVLDDIVDEIQSAVVTDRQILDGPFILNEIVHWCKNKKKQSMIFKVYFEKAYDSVRWDFINDILRRFGFGEKWCKWIQSCLYSSRGSALVNGTPTKKFQFHKESIRARFFSGADVNSKKPSWVRWKSVLAAKDVGVLGVSSLFALNQALMFKWVWRLFSQKNSLWVRVVKALHGEDGKIGKKL